LAAGIYPAINGAPLTLAQIEGCLTDALHFSGPSAELISPEPDREHRLAAIVRDIRVRDQADRLYEIAEIIEAVDQRCMAADGAVAFTRDEITTAEIRRIYELATQPLRSGDVRGIDAGDPRTPNISDGNDLPDVDGANPRTPHVDDEPNKPPAGAVSEGCPDYLRVEGATGDVVHHALTSAGGEPRYTLDEVADMLDANVHSVKPGWMNAALWLRHEGTCGGPVYRRPDTLAEVADLIERREYGPGIGEEGLAIARWLRSGGATTEMGGDDQ
jgi:hypothetical protein